MTDNQTPAIRTAHIAKRRNPASTLLIAILAIITIMGAFGILPLAESHAQTAVTSGETKPIYFALDPMVVPFNDKTVPQHYLKITITFELADQSGVAALQALKPRIVDNFQDYLQNLHVDDIHGSDAVDSIRSDLLSRVHIVAPSVLVKNVLIQELLTQ